MAGDQRTTIEWISIWVHTSGALCIGFILLYSSAIHLSNPYAYLSKVYSYDVLAEGTGVALAAVLPSFELTTGLLLLFFARCRLTGFIMAAVLFLAFSGLQIQALGRGLNIACGCFSSNNENPINWFTIGRTLAFFVIAVLGIFTNGALLPLWCQPRKVTQ